MDWLLRYWLGMTCRQEDYDQVSENFPELLNEDTELVPRRAWPFWWFEGDAYELVQHLRAWLRTRREALDHPPQAPRRSELDTVEFGVCPAGDCPLRVTLPPEADSRGDAGTPDHGTEEKLDTAARLDIILGGERNPPKKSFLDLVRKHHSGRNGVKQVIITDPYLLADAGETGERGGYDNVIEYLKALGLTERDSFELLTNPHKTRNHDSKAIFDRAIATTFKNVTFGFYHSKFRFHDRLFLVRDKNGILTGVFGPSLNGLSSDSIVLMGEIDEKAGLVALRRMFE